MQLTDYLRDLVAFYPTTADQTAILRLLEYVQAHCARHGLATQIVEHNGVHSLYGSTHGRSHARVMLQSHIDVVPTLLDRQKTLHQTGDKLQGRGVYDMLFAAACYLYFIEQHAANLSELDVSLFLNGDEEIGGFNSAAHLADTYTTDVCILPDAGDSFGALSSSAKGVYIVTVRIDGQAHHGSRPWEGDGAAEKLVDFVADFKQVFDTSSRAESTMTVAVIQAGDADNRGPSSGTTTLDIRYKNQADLLRIQASLRALLEQYNGTIVATSEGDDFQLDMKNDLVQIFIKQYEASHGAPIVFETASGSSDARFFAAQGTPVIMLRPNGGGMHGDEEWISESSLGQFYELIEGYILGVAKGSA